MCSPRSECLRGLGRRPAPCPARRSTRHCGPHRFFAQSFPNGRVRASRRSASAVRGRREPRAAFTDPARVHNLKRARRGAAWRRCRPRARSTTAFVVDLGGASSSSVAYGAAGVVSTAARSAPPTTPDRHDRPRRSENFPWLRLAKIAAFLPARAARSWWVSEATRPHAGGHPPPCPYDARRHGPRLDQSRRAAPCDSCLSQRKRRKIRSLKAERRHHPGRRHRHEEVMVFGGYLSLAVCTRDTRRHSPARPFAGEAE